MQAVPRSRTTIADSCVLLAGVSPVRLHLYPIIGYQASPQGGHRSVFSTHCRNLADESEVGIHRNLPGLDSSMQDCTPKRGVSPCWALLRQIRLDAKLRQVDLAERLGQPQSFVSKYESGERRLDILELRSLCKAVGITLEQFVARLEERLP